MLELIRIKKIIVEQKEALGDISIKTAYEKRGDEVWNKGEASTTA